MSDATKDHTLHGGILYGIEGIEIELQGRLLPGRAKDWSISISGLPGPVIRETLGRLEAVFAKYGFAPPEGEVLINLAPPDVPKQGTSLDLPIALLALQCAGILPDLPAEYERRFLFIGELGLHGEIRPVRGVLPIAMVASSGQSLVVPVGNQKEACMVRATHGRENCDILVANTFDEVVNFIRGKTSLPNAAAQTVQYQPVIAKGTDFSVIKGQKEAKRAMEIAAAGGHNALLIGPPGEGKSLVARALPTILPRLSDSEKVDLTRIYSAKGLLTEDGSVVTRRPFREVHHTASKQSLVGGGTGVPEPGEISLANMGVLFLDELPEFSRATVEAVRQPVENGEITISRVGGSMTFPARFTLIAAMNPCPCGFYGLFTCAQCMAVASDASQGCPKCGSHQINPRCKCDARSVKAYQNKISGPLLDRIDIKVDVKPLSVEEKFGQEAAESSDAVRARVEAARDRQTARYGGTGISSNAAIPGGQVQKWCEFEPDAFEAYKQTISNGTFSTRATDRLAKLSRTIADLEGTPKIATRHLEEATELLTGSVLM